MSEHDMFRTTLMGGYDKEDVLEQYRKIKDATTAEKNLLQQEIKDKDKRIKALIEQLEEKDVQRDKLKKEIADKYQKYIDHYESISKLLVDSQIKADGIVAEAQEKSKEILRNADEEVKHKIDAAQREIDEKTEAGKRKYIILQEELNSMVELFQQLQRRFTDSYEAVQQIIGTIPDTPSKFAKDMIDVNVEEILNRAQEEADEFLDEGFDEDEEQDEDISNLLEKDDEY